MSYFYSKLILALLCSSLLPAGDISSAGTQLAASYDAMDVDHHWLAGSRVDWQTGNSVYSPGKRAHHGGHGSEFVAAACGRLGVEVPVRTANELARWLAEESESQGWKAVASPYEAQSLANQGLVVVAVYANPPVDKSGISALVRPSTKSQEELLVEGPQVIHAGLENQPSTSLLVAFQHGKDAWRSAEDFQVRFFAHAGPIAAAPDATKDQTPSESAPVLASSLVAKGPAFSEKVQSAIGPQAPGRATITVNPVIPLPPKPWVQTPGNLWGGAIIGGAIGAVIARGAAQTKEEQIKALMEQNHIDLSKIVEASFRKQLAQPNSPMKLVDESGALELKLEVTFYGIHPAGPFSSRVVPVLKVKATALKQDGTSAWDAMDFVKFPSKTDVEPHSLDEIIKDPQLLAKAFCAESDIVTINILKKAKK